MGLIHSRPTVARRPDIEFADMVRARTIVTAALPAKSSAETPRNRLPGTWPRSHPSCDLQVPQLRHDAHDPGFSSCFTRVLSDRWICFGRFVSLQRPPDTSLLFGAVFGDPAPVSFGERAPESSGFKIAAVSRRSGLLPPGVVQNTTVDRVEAKIVDEAKHCCLGVRRIAGDRESNPPPRSPRNALLEKALGEDVVERLDHGMPDLLRDPLAVEHAPVDRIDVAIAKLGMVVADIDYDDAARHVRKQPPRKIGDGLRWLARWHRRGGTQRFRRPCTGRCCFGRSPGPSSPSGSR